jgi:Arc/MetJ-type ribon-helix-helix transcriptional regulator
VSEARRRDDRRGAGERRQHSQHEPSLSALEEALRQALETASREQVLQRIIKALPADIGAAETGTGPQPGLHGKVQKVSVSLPAELTEAVRARTGAGGFSHYVSEAVQEQLRLDLLDDLSADLTAAYGPVDDEQVRQAMTEWPDYPRR